jgi:hypothetical protein
MAIQEIAPARRRDSGPFFPGPVLLSSVAPVPFMEASANEPRTNRHAHGTVGYSFARGLSVGASGMWSDLNAMEGSELMFTGSHSLVQRGDRSELRFGALKEWGSRSLEAMLLTTRQDMAYDVGYAQLFWNPATRQTQIFTHQTSARSDARTDGVHLQYAMPLRDSTWRLGATATANVIRESGSPYYEFMGIPRDPSRTRAFNFGAGVSRRRGPTTLAVDAILEPAWRRATGPADTMFAIGAPTNREESYFRFHNVLLRGAVAREIAMAGTSSRLRLQAGTQVRAVRYDLEQHDFLRGTWRARSNSWREWTHGAGANFVFDRFEFGYQMRVLSGMGRLGVPPNTDTDVPVVFDSFLPGPVNVGVTLYPVRVTSHQMFLTVPVR